MGTLLSTVHQSVRVLDPGNVFEQFQRAPTKELWTSMNGVPCTFHVGIADYAGHIEEHFSEELRRTAVEPELLRRFLHFGVRIDFERPCTFALESAPGELLPSLKRAIDVFGPIFFTNLRLPSPQLERNHLAQFPQHRFHRDRGRLHDNQYSLYTRDPAVPLQAAPRNASTLFISNAVMQLQMQREELKVSSTATTATLFLKEPFAPLGDRVVFEQRWDAPQGKAELGVIDNRTVFHACRRRDDKPCYAIGAQYLQ